MTALAARSEYHRIVGAELDQRRGVGLDLHPLDLADLDSGDPARNRWAPTPSR